MRVSFIFLSRDLGGLKFAQDAEGNWGYKPSGADPVIPFSTTKTGLFIQPNDSVTQIGKIEIGFVPKIFCFISVGGRSCIFLYNEHISHDSYVYSYSNSAIREFNFDGTRRKINPQYDLPQSNYDCNIQLSIDKTSVTVIGLLNNQLKNGNIYWYAIK